MTVQRLVFTMWTMNDNDLIDLASKELHRLKTFENARSCEYMLQETSPHQQSLDVSAPSSSIKKGPPDFPSFCIVLPCFEAILATRKATKKCLYSWPHYSSKLSKTSAPNVVSMFHRACHLVRKEWKKLLFGGHPSSGLPRVLISAVVRSVFQSSWSCAFCQEIFHHPKSMKNWIW